MKTALLEQALELSPEEKLELLDAVWDSLTAEQIPLSEAEKALLDARLEEKGGFTWEEIKQRHKGKA
ncbi:MAG: addiction module protein [Meiothermus sp.]|nr:addiction module protein [Meiothermus sp.]